VRAGAVALLVLSSLAATLSAQSAVGRLEGAVFDSTHARPQGASIFVVRTSPPDHSAGATVDGRGRYHVDSLPVGHYLVELTSPFLDSLEIALLQHEVTIEAGRTARLDFALPSGKTLRAAACPGLTLAPGTGAVIGRVVDADSETPLSQARVTVAWRELSVDRATLQATALERRGEVSTDSRGRYYLCGVPTDQWLTLQLEHRGRVGNALTLLVSDTVGVLVRGLSFSASGSRPFVGQRAATDTTAAPPLVGTASVTGVIRGVGGDPLGGARVRVLGANGVAVSDTMGRFSLGDLPSGTQVLEAKRIGYLLAELPVELRAGRTASQDVHLRRIVTLDSIRVLARRSQYREFENHRKANPFGRFFSEDDIERRHATEASDLVRTIPGFQVAGLGYDAKVRSTRGASGRCEVNIVIDGMQHQEINLIHPSSIGTMELYREGEPGPIEFYSPCGAIVIWSRR